MLLKQQIFVFFGLVDGRAIFFKKRFSFKRGHITAAPDVWKKTKDFYFFFVLRFVIYFIFRLISTATNHHLITHDIIRGQQQLAGYISNYTAESQTQQHGAAQQHRKRKENQFLLDLACNYVDSRRAEPPLRTDSGERFSQASRDDLSTYSPTHSSAAVQCSSNQLKT